MDIHASAKENKVDDSAFDDEESSLLDIEDNDEEEEIEEVDDEQQVVVHEDHRKQLPFGAPKTKTATQALSLLPVSLTSAKTRKRTRSGRNTNMVKEIQKGIVIRKEKVVVTLLRKQSIVTIVICLLIRPPNLLVVLCMYLDKKK